MGATCDTPEAPGISNRSCRVGSVEHGHGQKAPPPRQSRDQEESCVPRSRKDDHFTEETIILTAKITDLFGTWLYFLDFHQLPANLFLDGSRSNGSEMREAVEQSNVLHQLTPWLIIIYNAAPCQPRFHHHRLWVMMITHKQWYFLFGFWSIMDIAYIIFEVLGRNSSASSTSQKWKE